MITSFLLVKAILGNNTPLLVETISITDDGDGLLVPNPCWALDLILNNIIVINKAAMARY